jgi:conjugal transfer mating pair stabilization protein TraN
MHKDQVGTDLVAKDGKEKLVCKGVPCIDGNCFDKSYEMDADMMDSVSKLYAVSRTQGTKDLNFKIFEGFSQSCSKKITEYTNCCSVSLKGWGTHLGAKCTKDEIDLVDKRKKNLCVHVGKTNSQTIGVTTVVKHKYCCFGSILNRVIQEQGRAQLGITFGTPSAPDCGGLTLTQIMQLDFNKMDFSDFFADVKKRMKLPQIGNIQSRLNSSMPDIKKYDGNPNNKDNKLAGWNSNIKEESK